MLAQGVDSALGAVAASPLQIRGAKWYIPNQVHMYMEPQTSVARWDEGGVIQVGSLPSPRLYNPYTPSTLEALNLRHIATGIAVQSLLAMTMGSSRNMKHCIWWAAAPI